MLVMVIDQLNAFLILLALECCCGEVVSLNQALCAGFIEMFVLLILHSHVSLGCFN